MGKKNRKKKPKQSKKNKKPKAVKIQKVEEEEQWSLLNLDQDPHGPANRDIHIYDFRMCPIDGGPPLINKSDIKLIHGRKYGLIGNNGAGKTTLLRHLASYTIPEFPKYLRVLHVKQEIVGSSMTVLETVLKADVVREALLAKEAELSLRMEEGEDLQDELQKVYDRLSFIESDTAISRAASILAGLQFSKGMQALKTSDLSGGWRMRVSLAQALFVNPDLLLLDEPTNHLDVPSVLWLTEYLKFDFEKTLLVVSHDRSFLNDVCTDIIHLDKLKLEYFKGNYDEFHRVREQHRVHQATQYKKQQRLIEHNKDFIRRFGANKKLSSLAQSRQKFLDKMELVESVSSDFSWKFEFKEPPKLLKDTVLEIKKVDFGYYGEDETRESYLLQDLDVRVHLGEKIGILGANGCGKSTLIKLIMKQLAPTEGVVVLNKAARIGYFAQHHIDTLEMDVTPLQLLRKKFASEDCTVQQCYAQLGRFKLTSMAQKPINLYSGGEKSRVAFAVMAWSAPHLIIMDEPTNHLDMASIDALIGAINAFNGTVLIVSHDKYFLEKTCSSYWCINNRKLEAVKNFGDAKKKCYSGKQQVDLLPKGIKKKVDTSAEVDEKFLEKHASNYSRQSYEELRMLMEQQRQQQQGMLAKSIDPTVDEEEKKQSVSKKKKKKKSKNAGGIQFDQQDLFELIDRQLNKKNPPAKILHIVKGVPPEATKDNVAVRMGYYMFRDLFFNVKDADYQYDPLLQDWADLFKHCIPADHIDNQVVLLGVVQKSWAGAKRDTKKRGLAPGILEFLIQEMLQLEYITIEALIKWKNTDEKVPGRADALEELAEFFSQIE